MFKHKEIQYGCSFHSVTDLEISISEVGATCIYILSMVPLDIEHFERIYQGQFLVNYALPGALDLSAG